MNECPYCHSTENQIKAGKTGAGSQRWRCKPCARRYTPEPRQMYSDEMRQQAIKMYTDGAGFRQVARHFDIDHVTVMLVDAEAFGADRETIRLKLEEYNIESRPLWKPMHCQPVYEGYEAVGGTVAESLFDHGLCLPSGTALTDDQLGRVVSIVRELNQSSAG